MARSRMIAKQVSEDCVIRKLSLPKPLLFTTYGARPPRGGDPNSNSRPSNHALVEGHAHFVIGGDAQQGTQIRAITSVLILVAHVAVVPYVGSTSPWD
jgi:hypothetical protein